MKTKEQATNEIREVFNECRKRMADAWIPVPDQDSIDIEITDKLGSRPTNPGALCVYLPDERFLIKFHPSFLKESGDRPETHRTAYHELVHTIPNCHEHNRYYMLYRKIIMRLSGYDILEMTDDPASSHLPDRLSLLCPDCGYHYHIKKQGTSTLKKIARKVRLYETGGSCICPYCLYHFKKEELNISEQTAKELRSLT